MMPAAFRVSMVMIDVMVDCQFCSMLNQKKQTTKTQKTAESRKIRTGTVL